MSKYYQEKRVNLGSFAPPQRGYEKQRENNAKKSLPVSSFLTTGTNPKFNVSSGYKDLFIKEYLQNFHWLFSLFRIKSNINGRRF